jgi:hypothetical protein
VFIRESELKKHDSWYDFSIDQVKFHKVEDTREYYSPFDIKNKGEENRLNRLFLRLDDKIDFHERRLYGVMDLLSDVGGIAAIMYNLG